MVKPSVKQSCHLDSVSGFEQPKTATYTDNFGSQFVGLKLWREHMKAKSASRKCVPLLPLKLMRRPCASPRANIDPRASLRARSARAHHSSGREEGEREKAHWQGITCAD